VKRLLGRAVRGSCIKIEHIVDRWRHHCLWDKQLSFEDANQLVVELLSRRDPFLVGRIGNTEGRIVGEYKFRNARFGRLTKKEAHQNAGIFPVTPEALARFSEIYWCALQSVDLLGFWQADFQSDLLVASSPDIKLAPLASLEPYLHAIPWSSALAGRRVLVVHPFASTIRAQYESRRALLFDNPFVLPIFDLLTLEPPQTLAPLTAGYLNWFDALNDLSELVLKHDFDVALLGCGAYGLPLGASIKAAGRQAIHLGGALQVLFGIRGRRWENMPRIASMMNESWVRPSVEETPPSAAMVEEGCYW
jgi:hypothetical protein